NEMYLGRLCFECGEYEEAVEHLKKAISMHKSPYYYSMLAATYFELGLNEEAVEVQNTIKTLRTKEDLPITTSRTVITKLHYLRNWPAATSGGPSAFASLQGKKPTKNGAATNATSSSNATTTPATPAQWNFRLDLEVKPERPYSPKM